MVTNGHKRFFGPFIAILMPVVVMYTYYDFLFIYFFQSTRRCAYFGGKNIKIRWKLTALWIFYLCYIPSVFWPQHGSYKLLGQTRGIAQMMTPEPSLQQQNEGKMNHWTPQQMMRSNWWNRCLPSTAIRVTASTRFETCEGLVREEEVMRRQTIYWRTPWFPPPLYKQYWEYLHASFCM